jgi:cell division protein FtsL
MNGFAGFMGRTLRGVRLVEFAALLVLLVMATGVYLAKASAGRERANITEVQAQIEDEQKRLRLLQAEVAHLEEPERLVRLSAEIGLAPTSAKHEGAPDELGEIARAALVPDKAAKKAPGTQAGFVGPQPSKPGAPQ